MRPPVHACGCEWVQVDRLKALVAEGVPALHGFWGAGRLEAVCRALIEKLLPLTGRELEEW